MQLEGMMAEFVYVDNSNADIEGKLVSAEHLISCSAIRCSGG